MTINYRSADLAKRLGIGPRTKNYTARDEDGLPTWDGDTAEQVLCGLKLAATGDMPLMLAAAGLLKALTTGRMDPIAASAVMSTRYSPYRVCQMVAAAIAESPTNRGVGYVAEEWVCINRDRIIRGDFVTPVTVGA